MQELNLDTFLQSEKEFIESVIETCKTIFYDAFGLDFSRDDCLKVAFSTFENHADVYEDFCKQFFPLYLAEDYDRDSFFTAQAFTNTDKGIYGILICLDVKQEHSEWYEIILHEMSHLFCITHEIAGENFNAKYSKKAIKENIHNKFIYVGYAVWREFIADYIANRINPIYGPLSLVKLREFVRELDKDINIKNPYRVADVSQMLVYIFVTDKIQEATDIETVFKVLIGNRIFSSKSDANIITK